MKAVFGWMVSLTLIVGCSSKAKNTPAHVATAEEIQAQKDNEKQVNDAEREVMKKRPKDTNPSDKAEDEERRRSQGR